MTWDVEFYGAFEPEFRDFPEDVRNELLAVAKLLQDYGPQLGRPHADTLKGSEFSNMKELRFEGADGEWRAAFAFDPRRKAIILVAGDKSGGSETRFYKKLITKADRRFTDHLEHLAKAPKRGK